MTTVNVYLIHSLFHTVRDYDICGKQLGLSEMQKTNIFVKIFVQAARNFPLDNFTDDMTFKYLLDIMVNEYDSDARLRFVQSDLENDDPPVGYDYIRHFRRRYWSQQTL